MNKRNWEKVNEITVGLIKGRHDIPVKEFIWEDEISNVTDHEGLVDHVVDWMKKHGGVDDVDVINVYVTGLTPALLALISVCIWNAIELNAFQYDRENDRYYDRNIISTDYCPFCKKRAIMYRHSWACPHCGAT